MTLGVKTPEKIRRNYHNNLWEEKTATPWLPEDFQHVSFEKNLNFNYHVDLTDLLSDKLIILQKVQWIY